MKTKKGICDRCGDDLDDEPKDHTPPCRIRDCRDKSHAACEH